jgi:hypothetical protein
MPNCLSNLKELASGEHFSLLCPAVSGEEKSLITLTPVVNVIKLFTSRLTAGQNKPNRLSMA